MEIQKLGAALSLAVSAPGMLTSAHEAHECWLENLIVFSFNGPPGP